MTSPSNTGAGSSPADGAEPKDDDGNWGAETDFDSLEKEASKIFAVWETSTPGTDVPAAAAPPVVEEKETWTAAPAPVAVAPAVAAPAAAVVAAEAPVVAAIVAPVVAPTPPAEPLASIMISPEASEPSPPVVHTSPPASLPDVPAVAPVRPSQRPAPIAPVAVARKAPKPVEPREDPIVLPSAPPYAMIAGAAVTVIIFLGLGGWYLNRTPPPPPTSLLHAAAPAPSIAAPPPSIAAPPPSVASPPPVTTTAAAAAVVTPVVDPVPAPPVTVAEVVADVAPMVAPPPVIPTHRLRVTVTPSQATLLFDGEQVVNPLDRQIPEGAHTVVASLEGYESETESVDGEHDRSLQLRLHEIAPPPVPHASSHGSHGSHRLASRVHTTPAHPPTTGRRTTGRSSTLVTESPY